MEKVITRWVTVDYTETITEEVPVQPHPDGYPVRGKSYRPIGKKRMRCKVEITVDLEGIAADLGRKAATSKGGKSQDGYVRVKRTGPPEELSREMNQ